MPSCAKFLKNSLPNKGKLLENAMMSLTKEYNTIIKNKLPYKISDPGSFSIPYFVTNVGISRVPCDLKASVSILSHSICKKLHVS